MCFRILVYVFVVALVFGAGSLETEAQCTDTRVDFPSPDRMTISFPNEAGTSISFPASTGMHIENSCDGLIVTVPAGAIPTITLNRRFLLTVNARKMEPPVTMDPLPYEVIFPRGGRISITRKHIAGVKYEDITVQGTSATIRPMKVIPREAK